MANDRLHPDESKMFEELKKEIGGADVVIAHPDQLDSTTVENASVVVVTMDAGDAQQASEMGHVCNDAVVRNPEIKFVFGVNGLRDDPREIDQTPEGRITLRTLFMHLTQRAFHRFDIEHQALMLVAMNLGYRAGTQLIVPPEMVRRL